MKKTPAELQNQIGVLLKVLRSKQNSHHLKTCTSVSSLVTNLLEDWRKLSEDEKQKLLDAESKNQSDHGQ